MIEKENERNGMEREREMIKKMKEMAEREREKEMKSESWSCHKSYCYDFSPLMKKLVMMTMFSWIGILRETKSKE